MTDFLDDFLAVHMTPLMKQAGFRRSGRIYRLNSSAGLVLVRVFKNHASSIVGFNLEWTPLLAALLEYRRDYAAHALETRGLRLGRHWVEQGGPFTGRIVVPEQFQERWTSGLWTVHDRDLLPTFCDVFEDTLRERVIPKWHRALTREYLLNEASGDPDSGISDVGWKTRLFLDIDSVDPTVMQERLMLIPSNGYTEPELSWFRHRLQARLAIE